MLIFSKFFPNFGILERFYSKTAVFETNFSQKGLIRSTCGPDFPRASRALRMDAYFCQGLPQKKERCAHATVHTTDL